MNRTPVRSSNIRSVGYDGQTNVLEIEFIESGIYQYFGVPPAIHADLLRSSSVGQYFQSRIKDKYPFKKVS